MSGDLDRIKLTFSIYVKTVKFLSSSLTHQGPNRKMLFLKELYKLLIKQIFIKHYSVSLLRCTINFV